MLSQTIDVLSGAVGLYISLALLGVLLALEFVQALDHPGAELAVRVLWLLSAPLVLVFAAAIAVGLAEGSVR